jgi:hypothetical protein
MTFKLTVYVTRIRWYVRAGLANCYRSDNFVIAVVGAAVAITRYTTKLEDRINLLEERLNTHRESLDIQRDELSNLRRFFERTGFELFRGRLKNA